jgi:hypothetical protein
MSEPFPTAIELALERLTKATTQLARTLSVSDSRHADGQAAILSRLADIREGQIAVLEALGMHAKNGKGREPSGVHFSLGDGSDENTTRFQFGAAHWKRVRPIFLWAASSLATAIGLGKLFAHLNGSP